MSQDIVAVWKSAYRLLRTNGNRFNLTLHVLDPMGVGLAEAMQFDPHFVLTKADSLRDVATTIFPKRAPSWEKPHLEFREHYISAYSKMLKRGRRSWGCYFLRMVEFGGENIDQLERVIGGLNGWGSGHKAAFTIHFSSADTEKPKPLGAPCLQYVQFLVNTDNKLSMTAVYRSHDYFSKALGNLVGLARLLGFVGERTGHEIATLTCLSTYAFVDVPKKTAEALLPLVE